MDLDEEGEQPTPADEPSAPTQTSLRTPPTSLINFRDDAAGPRRLIENVDDDPFDEDAAVEKYLTRKPACCVVLGPPGSGKTTVAKIISKFWKCLLINPLNVLDEVVEKSRNVNLEDDKTTIDGIDLTMLKYIYETGQITPPQAFQLVKRKLESLEICHYGYVLDDLPHPDFASNANMRHYAMSAQEQIDFMKSLRIQPDIVIMMRMRKEDIVERRDEVKVDVTTGQLITKQVYDMKPPTLPDDEKANKKRPHGGDNDDEEDEDEGGDVDEDDENEEATKKQKPIPVDPETVFYRDVFLPDKQVFDGVIQLDQKLLFPRSGAPEFELAQLEDEWRAYHENEFRSVCEDYFREFTPVHVLEIDGNMRTSEIVQLIIGKFEALFLVRPAVPQLLTDFEQFQQILAENKPEVEEGTADAEGAGAVEEETKLDPTEMFETLLSIGTMSPLWKWRESRFHLMCPVNMYQGRQVQGAVESAVIFMGRLYLLQDQKVLHKFLQCPRLYCQPSQIRPPCKVAILGPRSSGRTSVAKAIAAKFGNAVRIVDVGAAVDRYMSDKIESMMIAKRVEIMERLASDAYMLDLEAHVANELAAIAATAAAAGSIETESGGGGGESSTPAKLDPAPAGETREQKKKRLEDFLTASNKPLPEHIESTAAPPPEVWRKVEGELKAMRTNAMREVEAAQYIAAIEQELKAHNDERQLAQLSGGRIVEGLWILDNISPKKSYWELLADEPSEMKPDEIIVLTDSSAATSNEATPDDAAKKKSPATTSHLTESEDLRRATEQFNAAEAQIDYERLGITPIRIDLKDSITNNSLEQIATNVLARMFGQFKFSVQPLPDGLEEEEEEEEEEELEDEEDDEQQQRGRRERDGPAIVMGTSKRYDPVLLTQRNVAAPGIPTFAARYRNATYIFRNEENLTKFSQTPEKFIAGSVQPRKALPLRIWIVGPNGSGRTTLAQWCAAKYNLFYVNPAELLEQQISAKLRKQIIPRYDLPPSTASLVETIETPVLDEDVTLPGREAELDLRKFVDAFLPEQASYTSGALKDENEAESATDKVKFSAPPPAPAAGEATTTEVPSSSAADEAKQTAEEKEKEENDPVAQRARLGEQFEQPIFDYLREEELLPEEILQELAKKFYMEEPFAATRGFVMDGMPRNREEVEFFHNENYLPDCVVILSIEEETCIRRQLPKRKAHWSYHEQKKRAKKGRMLQKKEEERQAAMLKRREELRAEYKQNKLKKKQQQAEEAEAAGGESAGYTAEDEENEDEEFEASLEEIINTEFPEPEEQDDDEENEDDAEDRMRNEVLEKYEKEMAHLSQMRDLLNETGLPLIDINANRRLELVKRSVHAKLRPYTYNRSHMFEQAYAIPLALANSMVDGCYKLPSKFSRFCPVKCFEDPVYPVTAPDVSSAEFYPCMYSEHIYFCSSETARRRFLLRPETYVRSTQPPPLVMPPRLAILGPPKSGKTTLARKLAQELGIPRVSAGDALRLLLKFYGHTLIGKQINQQIVDVDNSTGGEGVVSDELECLAVQMLLRQGKCQCNGWILDGFPVTQNQLEILTSLEITPFVVVELQLTPQQATNRALLEYYYAQTSLNNPLPLNNSPLVVAQRLATFAEHTKRGIIDTYSNRYNNVVPFNGTTLRWRLSKRVIEEAVAVNARRVQAYLRARGANQPADATGLPLTLQQLLARIGEFDTACCVSLLDDDEFVEVCSNKLQVDTAQKPPAFRVEYNNKFYFFDTRENMNKFLQNAERYLPPRNFKRLPFEDDRAQRIDVKNPQQTLDADTIKQAVAYRGACLVTFYEGRQKIDAIVRGSQNFMAQYKNKIYMFASAAKLDRFVRNPHKYLLGNLPVLLASTALDDDEQERASKLLPNQLKPTGYLDLFVAESLVDALTQCCNDRPKYPFIPARESALIYISHKLRSNNRKLPRHERQYCAEQLQQFEKLSGALRWLAKNMPHTQDQPTKPPVDFSKKQPQPVAAKAQDSQYNAVMESLCGVAQYIDWQPRPPAASSNVKKLLLKLAKLQQQSAVPVRTEAALSSMGAKSGAAETAVADLKVGQPTVEEAFADADDSVLSTISTITTLLQTRQENEHKMVASRTASLTQQPQQQESN